MLCLGIESSCDDTGVAVVKDGQIMASLLASQIPLHAIFGGVVPELASRAHYNNLAELFDELCQKISLKPAQLDAIAVARGPGLLGSLLVGVAFAKTLAWTLQKPVIAINHLHAHLQVALMGKNMAYPCLGLVISGGHTELYRMESPTSMLRLGRSLDDAAGEILDKAGAFVGLPYPAGKAISDLASQGNPLAYPLPEPYLKNDNLDFSFSGLKTAAVNLAQSLGLHRQTSQSRLADFCASLNHALVKTVTTKCARALEQEKDLQGLCVAGGVAANPMLRNSLRNLMLAANGAFHCPPPELCCDNGAMIAYSGYLHARNGLRHKLDFTTVPRGKKIPEDAIRSSAGE